MPHYRVQIAPDVDALDPLLWQRIKAPSREEAARARFLRLPEEEGHALLAAGQFVAYVWGEGQKVFANGVPAESYPVRVIFPPPDLPE